MRHSASGAAALRVFQKPKSGFACVDLASSCRIRGDKTIQDSTERTHPGDRRKLDLVPD